MVSTMKAEKLVLENALFSQSFGNVSNQAEVRTIQTQMTNQQFADIGLFVIDTNQNQSKIMQYAGLEKFTFQSDYPQLVQLSNFDALVRSAPVHPKKLPDWLAQFEVRLHELDKTAIEDGIKISKKSLKDVRAFVAAMHDVRMPTVFLVGNGNVRLRWANNQGEKVGLQFRGNNEVQFLFFKRDRDNMEQMLGVKQMATIGAFISTCGLGHVIAE
jgi:hypothetical protein